MPCHSDSSVTRRRPWTRVAAIMIPWVAIVASAQMVSMSQCTGAPVATSNRPAAAQKIGAARIHAHDQPSSA